MSKRNFILGLGVGLAIGYIIRPKIEIEKMTPERALKEVKKAVSRNYTISGSWIHMLPETIEHNHINYEIYRGGLSTKTDEGTVQYDFTVDARTGALLKLQTS